jgi:hypothetical protein
MCEIIVHLLVIVQNKKMETLLFHLFDTHGSVHRRLLSRNTNNMQLCNRIYYSKVF